MVVRTDFPWDAIERQRNVYDFSVYDALVKTLVGARVQPYFVLDYANPLYDEARAAQRATPPRATVDGPRC